HGGGFHSGSGNVDRTDGSNLASRHDVVAVTVNHRLGALGYLYLGEIAGAEYATSGGVGMLDLVQALQWIHDNIRNFGGDPERVMISGCSGGGGKVSYLLGMPAARGLFQRAVIESGPRPWAMPPDEATEIAREFLDELKVGPSNLDDLFTMPAEQL